MTIPQPSRIPRNLRATHEMPTAGTPRLGGKIASVWSERALMAGELFASVNNKYHSNVSTVDSVVHPRTTLEELGSTVGGQSGLVREGEANASDQKALSPSIAE